MNLKFFLFFSTFGAHSFTFRAGKNVVVNGAAFLLLVLLSFVGKIKNPSTLPLVRYFKTNLSYV